MLAQFDLALKLCKSERVELRETRRSVLTFCGYSDSCLCERYISITQLAKRMIGKPGPFQIIESDGSGLVDSPMSPPRRRYECTNYATCLDLAAALNWDNFTCRGCCGEIDETLYWRAHQASKKDSVANSLCEIPNINYVATPSEGNPAPVLKLVSKR